nr:uncharacterized protein LOC128682774 [Plodia interpunctella]
MELQRDESSQRSATEQWGMTSCLSISVQVTPPLVKAVVQVNCDHIFSGTTLNQSVVYYEVYWAAPLLRKVRTVKVPITLYPEFVCNEYISGFLIYDQRENYPQLRTNTSVTLGGLGFYYVNLAMVSKKSKSINVDIYIYSKGCDNETDFFNLT